MKPGMEIGLYNLIDKDFFQTNAHVLDTCALQIFTSCIFHNSKDNNQKYKHVLQQTFSYSKLSIQIPEKGVNLFKVNYQRYQKDVNGVLF